MRLVSWRFWALMAALGATWAVLGHLWDSSTLAISIFSKIGIIGTPVAVVLFMIIYGVVGKWWRTDFGNRLVMLPVATMWLALMLLWAVLFHGGKIDTPITAWLYTGGYLFQSGMLFWGCFLWLREARSGRNGSEGDASRASAIEPATTKEDT